MAAGRDGSGIGAGIPEEIVAASGILMSGTVVVMGMFRSGKRNDGVRGLLRWRIVVVVVWRFGDDAGASDCGSVVDLMTRLLNTMRLRIGNLVGGHDAHASGGDSIRIGNRIIAANVFDRML